MGLTYFVLANLVLAQMTTVGPGSAQAPQAAGAPATSKAVARRSAPVVSMHRALSQVPSSMPVPVPNDAKFVTGYQTQYQGSRAMTYVRMLTENPPATLIDWYRQNLKAYGWTFKEKAPFKAEGLPSLSGTKGGVTCMINFEAPGKTEKTTAIMITFNEAH